MLSNPFRRAKWLGDECSKYFVMGFDMAVISEKFATQVDSDLLAAVRQLAHDEGRQIQAIGMIIPALKASSRY